MPAAVDPTSAIVQGGIGLATTAIGLINAAKTKKEAERLARERPQYEISPLVGEGLSLAESDLANGMSAGAQKSYNDLNNQQFSASLGAILKGGGGVNSIGAIYGNNQEGRLKLAMMKDQLRLQQINNYVRQSERKQQEEQTAWQINEFSPWQDRAQANAQARQGAQQQIWQGVNALGGAAMNYSQAVNEDKRFNQIYGNRFTSDNVGFSGGGRATGVPLQVSTAQPPNVGNLPTMQPLVNPFPYQGYPTLGMQNPEFNNQTPWGTKF